MPPPRDVSAEAQSASIRQAALQTPEQIAGAIAEFCESHPESVVLEDGRAIFDLRAESVNPAKFSLNVEHERCTLHLWGEERNMVRRVVSVAERSGVLRMDTLRFGQKQTKLLEIVADRERRTSTTKETIRVRYVATLERVLTREFEGWKTEGFRTSMDLKSSFGPAYARGSLVKGKHAWAIVGVNDEESATTIDGVLTIGILWLHACREQGGGRRLYQGLKIILPRGTAMLTLSRLAWMSKEAAQWELWEFDQRSEELEERDAADQGNLRTRLVHHPDERAAADRFAKATARVIQLVPDGDGERVEQRLRSTSELAFSLHGLEFARARIESAASSFAQTLEITIGVGSSETQLTASNYVEMAEKVAELFARRRAAVPSVDYGRRGMSSMRRIGSTAITRAAHSRINVGDASGMKRQSTTQDPLYRAAPERWLESVLRRDLAPLTRGLTRASGVDSVRSEEVYANEADPDTIGNRADIEDDGADGSAQDLASRVIPRLDPVHVYSQVPAIAGASDRGMLDLLGVTADGRLAVIELKADDDLHFALQGLDYWIRVRQHHLESPDAMTGMGEFQRHGYFRGIELSPLPPRLYLVAPALRIHPATETVLRYFSTKVEWNLLALDERWRQEIRVVWRKQGGKL
jgi:hypothetical protein